MSLPDSAFAAYLLLPEDSVQAEEDIAMLKEFNHIARQMLFLHGHLVRPADFAENAPEARAKRARPISKPRARAMRLAAACLSCGIVTPARFVHGQIR
jgi:hypothetical protein